MIDRITLSLQYAKGKGIEIGAYHSAFPVNLELCQMTYVDKHPYEKLVEMASLDPNLKNSHFTIAPVDIVDDGETLKKVDRNSYDFVVSSHQLEHCYNPIGALENQLKLLKPNGVGIFILPNHDNPIDKNREVTALHHLIGHVMWRTASLDRRDHFQEYLSVVDGLKGPELSQRIQECVDNNADIHFHVFDQDLVMQMLSWAQQRFEPNLIFKTELFSFNGSEMFFVLRRL